MPCFFSASLWAPTYLQVSWPEYDGCLSPGKDFLHTHHQAEMETETQHKSVSLNWKMMLLHMVLKLIGTLEMVHLGPHSTLHRLEGKEMSLWVGKWCAQGHRVSGLSQSLLIPNLVFLFFFQPIILLPDWLQLLEIELLKEPIEWKLQWKRLFYHQHWDGGRMTTARPPEVFCVLTGIYFGL